VVARAHADAARADDLRDVVRVDALDGEGEDRAAGRRVGGAVQRDAVQVADAVHGVGDEVELVGADAVHPDLAEPVHGGAEADDLRDGRRAGLELRRDLGEAHALLRHGGDHVPAAEQRRQRVERRLAAVQHADARRPVGLVARPGVEVGVDLRDVHGQLRHGLRAVDDAERPGGAGARGDLGDGVDRPQDVRDVDAGDDLHAARGEEAVQDVEVQAPVGVHRHPEDLAPRHLPRDDVRVVLHLREHDLVARAHGPAGDEVHGLRRVAREDRGAASPPTKAAIRCRAPSKRSVASAAMG
jgi:hypothetical protein